MANEINDKIGELVANSASTQENILPQVVKRFYDNKGRLNGLIVLVEKGELPVTGQQYAEAYRRKYLQD